MSKYKRPTIFINGKQRLLSRVVMERSLERPLESDELVHHIDHNPFNNSIQNLQLTTRSAHKKLHSDIGTSTRLKKKWHLTDGILELYKSKTIAQIAGEIGCSEITIRRYIKSRVDISDLRKLPRKYEVGQNFSIQKEFLLCGQ